MARLSLLLAGALFLAGCGDLLGHFHRGADGGPPGGDAAMPLPDGGDAGPADTDGGTDAGLPDAGGRDAGPFDAGPGTPFTQWSANLALNPPDLRYAAVAGTSASDAYIVGSNTNGSFVEHWDGGTLTVVASSSSLFEGVAVTPDGTVLVVGQNVVLFCNSACGDPVTALYREMSPIAFDFTAVCAVPSGVSGPQAYAAGRSVDTGSSVLWSFDNGWSTVDPGDGGAPYYKSCFVDGDGSVYVATQSAVMHYPPNGGPSVPEDSGQGTGVQYWSVSGAGGLVFASGDEKCISVRQNGTWTPALTAAVGRAGAYYAIATLSPEEAFAGGFRDPVTNEAHFFKGVWGDQNDLPTSMDVTALWSPDPSTLFVVGAIINVQGGDDGAGFFIGTR